ncbi:hypothetical protein P7C70_g2407, partial [Phenoliferia sp. Uapishka_3]
MFSGLSARLGLTAATAPSVIPPSSNSTAPDLEDNEPPQFPLPNSIQRASSSATAAPPPPPPSFSFDSPDDPTSEAEEDEDVPIPPIQIEPDSLAAPTSTKKRVRVKVAIEKGYSQLDWGRLQRSGADLRVRRISFFSDLSGAQGSACVLTEGRRQQGGVTQLARITPEELAKHKSKADCWQAYGGKVYNVTPFIKYHPGGVPELMRANGRDGTELFMKTHAWVNADLMLDGCLVGFLVR